MSGIGEEANIFIQAVLSGFVVMGIYDMIRIFRRILSHNLTAVTLEDLFVEGSDYISAISENIKTQMQEQMAADEGVIYFLDNDDMPEFNFQGITEQTNFYFNEKDELVIAFDEYEVAPGSMGAPEFVIPQEVTAAILK